MAVICSKVQLRELGVKASKAELFCRRYRRVIGFFCTGLILVIALLSTCIFSNNGSPSSRSECAGFFSYLFSVIAPGALSLFSLLSGGVVFFPSRLLFVNIFIIHAVASILVLISASDRAKVP